MHLMCAAFEGSDVRVERVALSGQSGLQQAVEAVQEAPTLLDRIRGYQTAPDVIRDV